MPPEIKKSYNPFKMWGSWIGLVVAGIWLFALPFFYVSSNPGLGWCSVPFSKCALEYAWENYVMFKFSSYDVSDMGPGKYYQVTIIELAAGFLLGWGIHSLFRKFSK